MSRRLIALTALTALLLVSAAPASADDASLHAAWTSRDVEVNKLYRQWKRALRRWERSGLRDWKPLYRANKAIAKAAAEVEAAVAAQAPSTAAGGRVKKLALLGLRNWRRSYGHLARATRLASRRRAGAAHRAFRSATRYGKRADRYTRRADRAFRAMGFR